MVAGAELSERVGQVVVNRFYGNFHDVGDFVMIQAFITAEFKRFPLAVRQFPDPLMEHLHEPRVISVIFEKITALMVRTGGVLPVPTALAVAVHFVCPAESDRRVIILDAVRRIVIGNGLNRFRIGDAAPVAKVVDGPVLNRAKKQRTYGSIGVNGISIQPKHNENILSDIAGSVPVLRDLKRKSHQPGINGPEKFIKSPAVGISNSLGEPSQLDVILGLFHCVLNEVHTGMPAYLI